MTSREWTEAERERMEIEYESERSAGCYDNAYVSENVVAALCKRRISSEAYVHGYYVGFFGSYELHEVSNPDDYVGLMNAIAFARKLGFDDMRDGEDIGEIVRE